MMLVIYYIKIISNKLAVDWTLYLSNTKKIMYYYNISIITIIGNLLNIHILIDYYHNEFSQHIILLKK